MCIHWNMNLSTPVSVYQLSSYPLIYTLFNFMSFWGCCVLTHVLTKPVLSIHLCKHFKEHVIQGRANQAWDLVGLWCMGADSVQHLVRTDENGVELERWHSRQPSGQGISNSGCDHRFTGFRFTYSSYIALQNLYQRDTESPKSKLMYAIFQHDIFLSVLRIDWSYGLLP